MPYLPLVYTHPQAPTFFYAYGKKRPQEITDHEHHEHHDLPRKRPGSSSPQQSGQRKNYKPSYPSTISKKSIPYGCNVDYKVKYDIEKVEYFDEKCETKHK